MDYVNTFGAGRSSRERRRPESRLFNAELDTFQYFIYWYLAARKGPVDAIVTDKAEKTPVEIDGCSNFIRSRNVVRVVENSWT